MMHPKMVRRILTVAREKLTPDERDGFFTYFQYLKNKNDNAPRAKKRALEELLLIALSEYLPDTWQTSGRRRTQQYLKFEVSN